MQLSCKWQPQVKQQVWQRLLNNKQVGRIAAGGSAQNISNALLALVRLSAVTPRVISQESAQACGAELLLHSTAGDLAKWSDQNIGNAMWLCAKIGLSEHPFVHSVCATAAYWAPRANSVAVVQVAYACGALKPNHTVLKCHSKWGSLSSAPSSYCRKGALVHIVGRQKPHP